MATVKLKVTRGDPDSGSHVDEYEVPYSDGMSLLDAVLWIREHTDSTLVARYSCRTANACKECSANIDGKAGYLCNTKAVPDSAVEIGPLSGRTWIRDLVTDQD